MNKKELEILYDFANNTDTVYCYDWTGFDWGTICPLINKVLNEYQQLKEIEKEHQRINGELRVENQKLKKQYCERTDCIGRLGNSKKVEQLIKENQELKDRIDKAVEILGEYKHYSTPDEIQNMLNEEIVDKAFILLKGDKEC